MTTMTLDAAKAQSDYRHEGTRRSFRTDQRGSTDAGTSTTGRRGRNTLANLRGWLHHA